ncbi:MAG: xylulokinase [Burkholderiales bacterium]|nr:xylulokinase [Burkholderiales bacterium]
MALCIGIDVGTSAVKVVVADEAEAILAEREAPLSISRPGPNASEQNPEDWWTAVAGVLDALAAESPRLMSGVRAIGLSGQMHGAVLLGPDLVPLRPAMLWNDGRAAPQARMLRERVPELARVVGVPAMPGFTGPKIPWLAEHEPGLVERVRVVMLPKDFVRLRLTGEVATDMSDAAGTWWLDEARRAWSPEAAEATGLPFAALPPLFESPEPAGALRGELAARWGMPPGVVVAAGAGDAAAGAVGIGAMGDGATFLSLGTSAQLFVSTAGYRPAPEQAVHAFCHAAPGLWFQMGAMLNGASCLAFVAGLVGAPIETLLDEVEALGSGPSELVFLPYLSGERTPHDDADARGVFLGMTPATTRAGLVRAVLEGVAFSFADARDALASGGTRLADAAVIGGGARSTLWMQILADVLGIRLRRYRGGAKGPAFGAARLARMAFTGLPASVIAVPPAVLDEFEPDPSMADGYAAALLRYRLTYRALRAAGAFTPRS